MKKKELLKQIIRDYHLKDEFTVKPRELKLPIDSGKIITLIGIRRSGKTSIFYETINSLTKNIDKTETLFINFEDERLDLDVSELNLILEAYRELYPHLDLSKCYLFFDEIQNVSGWEKFIRRIYDNVSKNIFLTGSNSKLLSSEIATSLRGRTLTFEVYPLSFREYLQFNSIEIDLYSSKSLGYIKNSLEKYLYQGGFPELIFLRDEFKTPTLQEYFDVLIYRDLIERYKINNSVALKFFIKRVLKSSTKLISINKIYNELKSSGIKIGKNSLYTYLSYVQNVYLALMLQKYDNNLVNKEFGEKKIYGIDNGLVNAIDYNFSKNIGKLLENCVFLELKRRKEEIFYFRDSNSECDFLIAKDGKIDNAIQVTLNLENEDTKKRELKGILNACKEFNLNSGVIITYDSKDIITINDIKIEIIPFYEWALN